MSSSLSSQEDLKDRFLGTELSYFGYDFFGSEKSQGGKVSVTPDYTLSPGDEVIINLWGRINERFVVEVSREGSIYLPKIGEINVLGVAFKDLREFLKREISRYYTDFDISVTLGNISLIRVYLTGFALKPGAYNVSGISTLVSVLSETGGADVTGSLRKIKVIRNGQEITEFDAYKFILYGDKSKDVRVIQDDVIYIPPIGKTVAVLNGVKKPAIYELKENEKLKDLIQMAGGFVNVAYSRKLSIKRIFENKYRDYLETNISDIENDESQNIELDDGDIISFSNVDELDTSVGVYGAVYFPGKYGIKKYGETRICELIDLAGGLRIEASNVAEVMRYNLTEKGVETERFEVDVKKACNGDEKNNIVIKPFDSIVVKRIEEWYYPKFVSIKGEVVSPGSYTIAKKERLSSLIKRAGGFTKDAYPKGIVFIRKSVMEQQQKMIEEIASRIKKELFLEGSQSVSGSFSQEDVQIQKTVLEQKKAFVEQISKLKAQGRVYIKFDDMKKFENSEYDIELEEGDEIIIPRKPSVVNVAGAVMMAGSYVYTSSSWKHYISMAGGYASYADKKRAFVLRFDGSAEKLKAGIFGMKIEPGDTIVVPEDFTRINWLREIKDITQIITNLALTTGMVIKVF